MKSFLQTKKKIINEKRQELLNIENSIKLKEGSFVGDTEICPLKHSFTDGIYVREIFIPAGNLIVGKIHKHSHPNFLMSGTVKLITEFSQEILTGPISIISKEGTKRALYSVTDLVWITVHHNPTNTQDLKKLEEIIIAESFEKYEKYISKTNFIGKFIKNQIRKLL